MRAHFLKSKLVFCCLLGVLSEGCAVLPAPRKAVGVVPGAPEMKRVDLSFIRAGSTRRKEVVRNLAWIDTGVECDKLFLGRWIYSVSVTVAYPNYGARNWGDHNLMVEFDPRGFVKRYRVMGDGKLVTALSAWVDHAQLPALDPTCICEMNIIYHDFRSLDAGHLPQRPAYVVFAYRVLEASGEVGSFRIPVAEISQLSAAFMAWSGLERNRDRIEVVIHFKEKTPVGTKLVVETDFQTLFYILRLVKQSRSKDGWDTPGAEGCPSRGAKGLSEEYHEAIRLKPDDAKPHNNLGRALDGKGDLDGAIAEYREAIRLKPDYAEAHCNLGNALGGEATGKSAMMPPWGKTLTQDEIRSLIAYIRAIAQPPYRRPAQNQPQYSTR